MHMVCYVSDATEVPVSRSSLREEILSSSLPRDTRFPRARAAREIPSAGRHYDLVSRRIRDTDTRSSCLHNVTPRPGETVGRLFYFTLVSYAEFDIIAPTSRRDNFPISDSFCSRPRNIEDPEIIKKYD